MHPRSVHQHANPQTKSDLMEPKGGFEPPTCRLQIGCAANCATWACNDPKPISGQWQYFALDAINHLSILQLAFIHHSNQSVNA